MTASQVSGGPCRAYFFGSGVTWWMGPIGSSFKTFQMCPH
jgi:hypothetical protein